MDPYVCVCMYVQGLSTGCYVHVSGVTVEAPAKHSDAVEVQADEVLLVGACDSDSYPLAKKRHSFEFLRYESTVLR
jgi:asparaginyl-tRNA synthetase